MSDPVRVVEPPNEPFDEPRPRSWRRQVLVRVERGLAELDSLRLTEGNPDAEQARSARLLFRHALQVARARPNPLGELRIWLTGTEIDEAWRTVHAAEE